MRTMTVVVVIFLALIGFSLGSYKLINNSSQNLVNHLQIVDLSIRAQNWDDAQKELALTQKTWAQTKDWWTILIDHQEIDNIDLSISRLEQYVATKATPLSLGELSALMLLFEHISGKEALTLENIL